MAPGGRIESRNQTVFCAFVLDFAGLSGIDGTNVLIRAVVWASAVAASPGAGMGVL